MAESYQSANNAAPRGYGDAGATAIPDDPNTLGYRLNAMKDIIKIAVDVASQAENLANMLAGTQPEKTPEGNKPAPVPNGLVEELATIDGNLRVHLGRIGNALNRLHRII
jgi:hypothetical protein